MAERLEGKAVAQAVSEAAKARAQALAGAGIKPALAIIRMGERADDLAYERGAVKRCESVGVEVRKHVLAESASQADLLGTISRVNADESVHGCLIFRPLPAHIDDNAVCGALAIEKDVDGITDGSLAGVFAGKPQGFSPCTAQACVETLDYYGYPIEGANAVVVGRSLVVGRPVSMLLMRRHATVTICHTRTRDLPDVCRRADILIAAAGRAGMIGGQCLSPGQIVLDVGINVGEDGKLCGDVKYGEAGSIVRAISPVPGGVGAVTSSILAMHVVEAAERAACAAGIALPRND